MQTHQNSNPALQKADTQPSASADHVSSLYVTEDKVDELYRVEKLLMTELLSEQSKGDEDTLAISV